MALIGAKLYMISNQGAAGMIARSLKGKSIIGPAWRALDEVSQEYYVTRWSYEIKNEKANAVRLICDDLQADPRLSKAWEACGLPMRESLTRVMTEVINCCDDNP